MEEYNLRRGLSKRQVKRFYYACRRFDEGLRRRMDAHETAVASGALRGKGNGATESESSLQPGALPGAERGQRRPRPGRVAALPSLSADTGRGRTSSAD